MSEDAGWTTEQAMCLNCGHLWQACFLADTDTESLFCEKCHANNSITEKGHGQL